MRGEPACKSLQSESVDIGPARPCHAFLGCQRERQLIRALCDVAGDVQTQPLGEAVKLTCHGDLVTV